MSLEASPTAPPSLYPSPIPVPTGDTIVYHPTNRRKVLFVRTADDPDHWRLPGAVYRLDRGYKTPFDAASKRLKARIGGLELYGDPEPFGVFAQKGRDRRVFSGFPTDHCLAFVQAQAGWGNPVPLEAGILEAKFFDLAELDLSTIGVGHLQIIEHWLAACTMRDFSFRYVRNENLDQPADLSVGWNDDELLLYSQPIPIITSTFLGYDLCRPTFLLLVELNGQPGKFVLPGGIFDWHRHRDQWQTGPVELMEETGAKFVGMTSLFAIDLRPNKDLRQWCSLKTNHCIDHIFAAPAVITGGIEDLGEVKSRRFMDVTRMTSDQFLRGHWEPVRQWLAALAGNGPVPFRFITN